MSKIDIATMDLNLLKVFEALHEEGGASRAAIRLGLTQSAVSASLRRLRAVYRDPLFTRTGRGLMPTGRADELKPLVAEALDRCRQTLTMTSDEINDYHGRLVSVGLSDDFEIAIARHIKDAVEVHMPGLRLIFRQTHSKIVAEALFNREVDLAITSGGYSARGLSRQVLGESDYACLIDSESLKKRDGRLTLDDYVSRPHLLVSSSGVIGIVDEALASFGRKRIVSASTTHFAVLPYLLQGSNAVATIPSHAAMSISGMTNLLMVPCPLDLPRYPIELGWRTARVRDSAAIRVQQLIVDLFNAAK